MRIPFTKELRKKLNDPYYYLNVGAFQYFLDIKEIGIYTINCILMINEKELNLIEKKLYCKVNEKVFTTDINIEVIEKDNEKIEMDLYFDSFAIPVYSKKLIDEIQIFKKIQKRREERIKISRLSLDLLLINYNIVIVTKKATYTGCLVDISYSGISFITDYGNIIDDFFVKITTKNNGSLTLKGKKVREDMTQKIKGIIVIGAVVEPLQLYSDIINKYYERKTQKELFFHNDIKR